MSRRAYNELYSSKYGHWEDASRINDVNVDFGNGDLQLQEVEIYSKWVWTSFNQFGMGNHGPNDELSVGSSGGGVPDFVSNTLQMGIPVAFSLEGTGSAESGGASSASPIGGILIIRGHDAFNAKGFSSAGVGGGWVSASAMVVGYAYYYFGNINNFSMKTFEGWGNNVNISGDIGFAVGINVSWVENPNAKGEYLIGVGFGGGIGISPTEISGQYTRQLNYIFW